MLGLFPAVISGGEGGRAGHEVALRLGEEKSATEDGCELIRRIWEAGRRVLGDAKFHAR